MHMPKVKLYNAAGKMVGEQELRADVFGVEVKPTLVHEVMVGLQANARAPYAHTKTRGDVSGGGKKPWKQKGTGRARQGSIRSPQWVGGGIVFGPRSQRDYTVKINRKVKKLALLMTLSDKVAHDRLMLVESFGVKDGKTKEMAALIGKLPVKGNLMLMTPKRDANTVRSITNLAKVRLTSAGNVNILELLKSDYVVATPDAVAQIEARYGSKA